MDMVHLSLYVYCPCHRAGFEYYQHVIRNTQEEEIQGKIIVVVSLWVERYEANMQHVRYEKDTVVLYFGDTDISFGGRSFD